MTRHAPAFFGNELFPGSALGVDLFFVMSGFVISYAYDNRIRSGLTTWDFAKLRLVRLYPLYILGTLIGIAVACAVIMTGVRSATTGFAWQPGQLSGSSVLAVLLLPSPPIPRLDDSLYPLNAVAWSLAFEIVINILYAASFRFWNASRLTVLVCVGAVSLVGAGLAFDDLDLGWNWHNWPGGAARIIYSFPCGVLIHWLFKNGYLKLRTHWTLPLLMAVACFSIPVPEILRNFTDTIIILIGFPLITFLAVQVSVPSYLVKIFAFLGLTSYAAYALHRPVLSLINGLAQVMHIHIERFAPWSALVFLPTFLAICSFVDIFYDQPVRRFFTARLKR